MLYHTSSITAIIIYFQKKKPNWSSSCSLPRLQKFGKIFRMQLLSVVLKLDFDIFIKKVFSYSFKVVYLKHSFQAFVDNIHILGLRHPKLWHILV